MSRIAILCIFILLVQPSRPNTNAIQTGGGSNPNLIERISVSSIPTQANGTSEWPSMSLNGRYTIYHSDAPNLVPNDTNNAQDVFVYDRLTRTTNRVSLGIGGVQGNNRSGFGDVSADGRYITFHSEATNLVPNDTNNSWDVYFRDLQTGEFERISVTSSGQQGNATSIFPDISDDGRFITFYSEATNLVPNDTNGVEDIFLHDRLAGTTERISVSSGGVQANGRSIFPNISSDGRYVVYDSDASNLVANDTNNVTDVFLFDRLTATTRRISVTTTSQQAAGRSSYPVIAANNRQVTFVSFAPNMHPDDPAPNGDIYVRDLVSNTTALISRGLNNQPTNGDSHYPVISADGRFIAYHGEASNIVPGDTNNTADIFLYDGQSGVTKRVSLSANGIQGNGPSNVAAISGNGRVVAFHSPASNLTVGDTNNAYDIFLYLDFPYRAYLPTINR